MEHRRIATSMRFASASDDGLGDFLKFPPEIRQMILRYVVDINSKFSDYLKGTVNACKDESFEVPTEALADEIREEARREKQNYDGMRANEIPGIKARNKDGSSRPRRTDILTVSKALSAEALGTMFKTNRFILSSGRHGGYLGMFHFFPLKADLAIAHFDKYYPLPLVDVYESHHCGYWEDLRTEIQANIRMLVVDFTGIHPANFSYQLHRVFKWRKCFAFPEEVEPVNDHLTRMLEYAQNCQKLHSLRIPIDIATIDVQLFLPIFQRLSKLRGIDLLEIRVFYNRLLDYIVEQDRLLLTKEYVDYLNSTTKVRKGTEVKPYEGELLTEDIMKSTSDVDREHVEEVWEDNKWYFDNNSNGELLLVLKYQSWMPWLYR